MDEYKVKVGQFEGPLDLLLDLIEKRKLHINDVSLAEVTDGYVEYIDSLTKFPTEEVSSFIAIASTLILIKSISLLPTLTISKEETANIEDLQERLRILKDVKDKSEYIRKIFAKNIIFFAEEKKSDDVIFSPTQEITIENFLRAMKDLVAGMPKKEKVPQTVIKKVISLEEAIDNLIDRVQKDLKFSFNKLNSGTIKDHQERKAEKVNVIINFLAVLELVKRGIIQVRQDSHFIDIDIENGKSGVPVYN